MGFTANQWQEVIDQFYDKYYGIGRWHGDLLLQAKLHKKLEIPSGRYYPITPEIKRGELSWPLTIIKNYPVQGFGADLVMLARLRAHQLIRSKALPISTVHDSLVYDVDNSMELCYNVACLLKQAVEEVPDLCRKIWGYDFTLPLTCEVQYGMNKLEMEDMKFE